MKLTRSQILAIIASLVLILWFVIRNHEPADNAGESANTPAAAQDVKTPPAPTVLIIERTASPHQQVLELFGQSEANRQVSVKANTASVVIKTPLKEGQIVNKGDIMCVQTVNERDARVAQASAQLQRAQLEYDAAVKLAKRGFRSETQVASQKAGLDAASATLPFRGLFERQDAHIGDYLAPGQPCGLVVEIDPLIITVQLTETQLSQVKRGQTADIKLATGERVQGKLRRIETIANPSTRSFRTEITVPNRKMTLKAGVTAEVRILSDQTVMAQNIPIIIKGQDFVADGTRVIPTLKRE